MKNNFFDNFESAKSVFEWTRQDTVPFLERAWGIYKPFADRDFRQEINRYVDEIAQLHKADPPDIEACNKILDRLRQRYWEMHCTLVLVELELDVIPYRYRPENAKNAGPDILVKCEEKKIWVECIAPVRGDKECNRVPHVLDGPKGRVSDVPLKKIALRYTSALRTKRNKFEEYRDRNKGIVGEEDVCIIAVNGANTYGCDTDFPGIAPAILRCLYGMGTPEMNFGGEFDGQFTYPLKPEIMSRDGELRPNNFFEREENSFISGVIFSRYDFLKREPMGTGADSIMTIFNSQADSPIPRTVLDLVDHYVKTDSGMRRISRRTP